MKNSVTSPKAVETVKVRRISAKIKQAVDLIITGVAGTQKQAAIAVGLSPEHLSRSLKEPHVQAFITRRVGQTLAQSQMKASAVLHQLLETSASDHVKKDLSLYLLELQGHMTRPPGVVINASAEAGYIISLRTPMAAPFATIKHDPAAAATLVDAEEVIDPADPDEPKRG
jgi:hypothetical protein